MTKFHKRLGEFGQYCPVSLRDNNELINCREEHNHPLETRLPMIGSLDPNYMAAIGSIGLNYDPNDKEGFQIRIPTNLRFAAEYRSRMYQMAGPDELMRFMATPEAYIKPNSNNVLPDALPQRLPPNTPLRDSFPQQIGLRGYCPVCFAESGLQYEGLKMGDRDILAEYKGVVYAFCSEECRTAFMQ